MRIFPAAAQLKRAIDKSAGGPDRQSRLSLDLRTEKIEMRKMLIRVLVILIAAWSLLSGCANTRRAGRL